MKRTILFGAICLIFISACGQVVQKEHPVSIAERLKIKAFAAKSISCQTTSPDSAIYFADLGLKLSRTLNYKLGEGQMLNQLGQINEQYGNLNLAIKYQKEAGNIFKSLHNPLSYDTYANLGILQAQIGKLSYGTMLINSSLKYYKNKRDTIGITKSYIRLGQVKELSGHFSQALQCYDEAEQLQMDRPITMDYFNLILRIGNLHNKLGNYGPAAGYYQKGIALSGAKEHIKTHLSFLNHAGQTHDKLGNKHQALAYHQQALKKAMSSGMLEEQARSLMGIAQVQKSQNADQSILHLKNALNIARSIGNRQLSQEIFHSLSEIYRQQSRYVEALKALEQHHLLVDSLEKTNMGHKIAALQSSYDLTESKLRIESLELSNLHKTEQRNRMFIFAGAILVILLVFAAYLYKTKRLNQRLKATNLIKDKLFSIIGHDLRNPIGGITQLLAIMEEGDLSAQEQHDMVAEMRKQGSVSLEILNALLNWGEAQLKGIHVKPSKFNAKNSITKNIFALQKQAADKAILFSDKVPSGLQVYGDINHFEFIIRNLLSNAIKFSHISGAIEIAVELNPANSEAIFSVRDYGKGISKKQQELFLKSNLDISFGTAGEKGTGIGLMLSKEFIKANHGRIWVDSTEGEGATFYFTFSLPGTDEP